MGSGKNMGQEESYNNNILQSADKPLIAVFVVLVFILLVVIVIQAQEIKREKCNIGCEKYQKENEAGLFMQLENLVWWFKKNWSLFVIYTASSSIILLFLLTLIFPQKDTLVIMNNWVSLILGFTALFMSVASMVLSFYNVEQSHNNEVRTAEMNEKVEQKLSNLDSLSKQLMISTTEIQHAREEIKSTREELSLFRSETNKKFEEYAFLRAEGKPKDDGSWLTIFEDEFDNGLKYDFDDEMGEADNEWN